MELVSTKSSKAVTSQDTGLATFSESAAFQFSFLLVITLLCACHALLWKIFCKAGKRFVKAMVKTSPPPKLQRHVVGLRDGQKVTSLSYPEVPKFFE